MCECIRPDLYKSKIVKVRKPHVCCACDSKIVLGDRCQKVDGTWDGDFRTYYTCLSCHNVWQYLLKFHRDDFDCMAHEMLYDVLTEEIEVVSSEEDDTAKGETCSIVLTVEWLKRGFNGRFELTEEGCEKLKVN